MARIISCGVWVCFLVSSFSLQAGDFGCWEFWDDDKEACSACAQYLVENPKFLEAVRYEVAGTF